ncbi:hypothetical protein BST81_02545 [Leptolyngbya sp. 'hensonii']|uniref:diguanylate cyclase domain-containing protein n=1 Tax=Leptolyngbya sp. 'hensonii' TaxID=1922337 RepID=UPI00095BBBE9|nr:diguanylate cyclase [Leptolyngbya sp. 'hensonii']OLP19970.1 hypothetical protein BST81_02545 [Leptolyngbya sp. 'hensonii']
MANKSVGRPVRIPFGIKLGLMIATLAVGIATASVSFFYSATYRLVIRQMTGRLADVGRTGAYLFDDESRAAIVRLKTAIEIESQVTPAAIQQIASGATLDSLPVDVAQRYHRSADFQRLVQILRKIDYASRQQVYPPRKIYPQIFIGKSVDPKRIGTYLLVTTPESPDRRVLKFLASSTPDPQVNYWQGLPIGQLYVSPDPVFRLAFDGQVQVTQDFFTDSFYTSVTAAIPIKDQTGQTIAVLGLDYMAKTEADEIQKLQSACAAFVGISFAISTLLALLLARQLAHPLVQLQAIAQRIRDHDYNFAVHVQSNDELGFLADTLNTMMTDISHYTVTLEAQNRQLEEYSRTLEQKVADRTQELLTANQQLYQLANSDTLTQLANRRRFNEFLAQAWLQAKREKFPISLLLCDVDYFKKYNDAYGHQAGDACLQQIAAVIGQAVERSSDLAARYGGEEFMVVLQNTDLQGAVTVGKRIQSRIYELQIEHRGSLVRPYVTLSMGIVSLCPTGDITTDQFINQADRLLYQAKQEGRDRIKIDWEEETSQKFPA